MDSLKIYNSLSREKQPFTPIVTGEVRMYVCGMTVYDYCHLGHARVMVVFDLVQRWLRQLGYRVTYVRNITDIDDKIIRRAVENNESISSLTERFIQAMNEDAEALGVQRPDHEPRATRFVSQMLGMIGKLEQKGLAYRSADGDVHYAVRNFPGYGRLSGKSLDDLRAGERVDVGQSKRDPLDFVLWKAAKPSEPAEVRWPSPWGVGRPGWHIECSAMAAELLGPHFDIHGGGQDLQFPHHENEIAQSEGAHGCAFVNVWMHNGFVRLDNEKMSKSLGNFFTIREVLKKVDAEVVRFFILRTHYRSPLNYSDTHLDDARQSLTRLYTALSQAPQDMAAPPSILALAGDDRNAADFCEALNDDFNTPLAFRAMFQVAKLINLGSDAAHHARVLRSMGNALGLLERPPQEFLQLSSGGADLDEQEIASRIQARAEAKRSKNFVEADRIRKELAESGILLEDRPGGLTEWRRA